VTPFDRLRTSSYSSYLLQLGHILYHFWDKVRYWSKVAIFRTPLYITTP